MPPPSSHLLQLAMSRRRFLNALGATGLAVGGSVALAGCGGLAEDGTAAATGTPRRGGTLRIGMVGAGETEGYDPGGAVASLINVALVCSVYDTLVAIEPDLSLSPALATEWTANADSTEWTVTLRDGVTWHDGTPLTTADVVYSMTWASTSTLSSTVENIDLAAVTTPDERTVVLPLLSPDTLMPVNLAGFWIIQDGTTDFTEPIGTGPFVFGSITPGQQSSATRNDEYWDDGKPYVDELVIQSITDDTARLNALLGGQIDVLAQLPPAQARAQEAAGIQVLSTAGVTMYAFYMAVDRAPFDDVRVRQAVRLAADREQLVEVALSGYGTVANDLFGPGIQYYDDTLPQREQDVAQAKALLAEAGYPDGIELTLQTSAVAPGVVEAATLLAEQAVEAGISITIEQVDPSAYFDPTRNYLTMPFAQTLWSGQIVLRDFYVQALVPGAAGNETHWDDPTTSAGIAAAVVATDDTTAEQAWQQLQQEQYDQGGYLWWAAVDNLDAAAGAVAGITPSRYLNLGLPGSLKNAYLTS